MSLSAVYERKTGDAVLGKAAITPPATFYLALLTAAPNNDDDAGALVEATYTGYARIPVTEADFAAFTGHGPASASNLGTLSFPQATGGSSTVTHFAAVDSAAGAGDMRFYGALAASRTITDGITPEFQAGDLTCTIT